jgi:hypothetical protein
MAQTTQHEGVEKSLRKFAWADMIPSCPFLMGYATMPYTAHLQDEGMENLFGLFSTSRWFLSTNFCANWTSASIGGSIS